MRTGAAIVGPFSSGPPLTGGGRLAGAPTVTPTFTVRGMGLTAIRIADVFCQQARHRIERLFAAIRSNADPAAYGLARDVLAGRYAWLEHGIIDAPEARHAEPERGAAAAGS